MKIRRSQDRGHFDYGWLDTRHTFSFGSYHDPEQMGFRSLRVINEDVVQPGQGFGTHPHRDMEILTWVLEGALQHRDSMENGSVIRPGEMQRMTAGTGVTHSEFNPSASDPLRLLQIWILPEREGLEPGYEQKAFPVEERRGVLRLVASTDGREGSISLHQDVDVWNALLGPDQEAAFELRPNRHLWIQVAGGAVAVGDQELHAGDGAALSAPGRLVVRGLEEADVLVFDLA